MFNYVNNGILEPYHDFRVDYFYGSSRGKETFFLSHMHEGNTPKFKFQIIFEVLLERMTTDTQLLMRVGAGAPFIPQSNQKHFFCIDSLTLVPM